MAEKPRIPSPTEPTLASRFLRVFLGTVLLFATVGLTTCQSFFGSFVGGSDTLTPEKTARIG